MYSVKIICLTHLFNKMGKMVEAYILKLNYWCVNTFYGPNSSFRFMLIWRFTADIISHRTEDSINRRACNFEKSMLRRQHEVLNIARNYGNKQALQYTQLVIVNASPETISFGIFINSKPFNSQLSWQRVSTPGIQRLAFAIIVKYVPPTNKTFSSLWPCLRRQ